MILNQTLNSQAKLQIFHLLLNHHTVKQANQAVIHNIVKATTHIQQKMTKEVTIITINLASKLRENQMLHNILKHLLKLLLEVMGLMHFPLTIKNPIFPRAVMILILVKLQREAYNMVTQVMILTAITSTNLIQLNRTNTQQIQINNHTQALTTAKPMNNKIDRIHK